MITAPQILLILAGFVCGLLLGYVLVRMAIRKPLAELQARNMQLEMRLEFEQQRQEERIAALEEARRQLKDTFAELSRQALKNNAESFLQLAGQNLRQYHIQAEAELEKKEKSIETLVKPIREALEKTEKQIHSIEKERVEAYGNISRYLQSMAETQSQLQTETRSLVQALRRPEVRGQWGELTLRRLAELAGMVDRCDFVEQTSLDTEDGRLRPDMIVNMPNDCCIVVDAKTPLDAYLSAVEAKDEAERRRCLEIHTRNIQKRIQELSSKVYWARLDNTPEFVVLFIPGEQFLNCALDIDRGLQENALRAKVILATPNNFIGLLKTVAFGWRQQTLAENANEIRKLGEDLYGRLATFTNHLTQLGKRLDNSVEHYNKAVGSLERNVLPGARKFAELGIHAKKQIEDLEPIEKSARLPAGGNIDKVVSIGEFSDE